MRIYNDMRKNGRPKTARCLQKHCEDESQKRCIAELVKIHMQQTEKQGREHQRTYHPTRLFIAVKNNSTKNKFLTKRSKNPHNENHQKHRHRNNLIRNTEHYIAAKKLRKNIDKGD